MSHEIEEDYEINFDLLGILEWLNRKGSTIKKFNDHILMGKLKGIHWRYFISDGWFAIMEDRYMKGSKSKAWIDRDELIEEFEMLIKEQSDE